jgi:hypothetical protein
MSAKYFQHTALFFSFILLMAGCKEDKYALPEPKGVLQNDVIKRSLGPNLVGRNIEFAYAMALPALKGKIVSAEVEASIAGAPATWLENKTYYSNNSGVDIPTLIGAPSVNTGNKTVVTFNKDTMASTLRYYYYPPEEARGKPVTFKFTAKSSNGETATYSMGPYNVSKMDMALNLTPVDGAACYISIADTAIYTAAQAVTKADKIDLVYVYRPAPYNHSFVSPGANAQYLPGVTLPAGVNKVSKLVKAWGLRDQQLSDLQFGIFIDDLDFQKLDLGDAADFAINMKAEAGIWVETADKKYRAYIFLKALNNTTKTATICIKRYTMN